MAAAFNCDAALREGEDECGQDVVFEDVGWEAEAKDLCEPEVIRTGSLSRFLILAVEDVFGVEGECATGDPCGAG